MPHTRARTHAPERVQLLVCSGQRGEQKGRGVSTIFVNGRGQPHGFFTHLLTVKHPHVCEGGCYETVRGCGELRAGGSCVRAQAGERRGGEQTPAG